MNLKHLAQFMEVARLGSYGQAARALYLSQPTLTRNIRSLEADLGIVLFERSPRGSLLTAEGSRLLPLAASVLNEAERLTADIGVRRARSGGRLLIGVSPNFYLDLLPEAIARLTADEQGLNVRVSSGTREALIDNLLTGDSDVSICQIPDYIYTEKEHASQLVFHSIEEDLVSAYAAAGHPALHEASRLETMVQYCWAVPFEMSVSYRFESAFFRNNLPIPIQSLNASSISMTKIGALRLGLLAMLPASSVVSEVRDGQLVRLDVQALDFRYVTGLIHRTDCTNLHLIQRLLGHLRTLADGGVA